MVLAHDLVWPETAVHLIIVPGEPFVCCRQFYTCAVLGFGNEGSPQRTAG
jgi:hypothetical protein